MKGVRIVKCKGCGQPAFLFTEAGAWGPAGSVVHSKPANARRRSSSEPSQVKCALYHQLDARAFFAAHEDEPLDVLELLGEPDAVMVLLKGLLLITRMQHPHLTLEQASELTVTAAGNYFKAANEGESS